MQVLTLPAVIVNAGFDVLVLDFDLVLLQNPLPYILQALHESGADVAVSKDLGSTCINTGVTYFTASEGSLLLLSRVLTWLWRHPYEFSQKAFAGFLGIEKITEEKEFGSVFLHGVRLKMLDSTNRFVTSVVYDRGVQGWTGDIESIVIYHFLDGTGGVHSECALAGRYVNLYELFYSNPKLDLANPSVPLWHQDPRMEAQILSARLDEAPSTMKSCGLL